MKFTLKKSALSLAALAFLALSFSPAAHASLYIEPFLGYAMGKTNGNPKEDIKGTDMGARVGFSTLGMLAFGAEVSKSDFTIDTSPKTDFAPMNLGVFAAFEFPILVRAYASYIIKSEGDISPAKFEGKGTRIGVGFTGLPFVAINVEYLALHYDKATIGGFSGNPDLKLNMWGINVSLPLNLF